MSVMTSNSDPVARLLKSIGVPDNAISVDIKMTVGSPVLVMCEFYPEEMTLSENGEIETIFKSYVLTETEIEDDGV